MSNHPSFISGIRDYNNENFSAAIVHFTRTIADEPSNAYIYFERAMAHFKLKNNAESLADLNTAQQLQPENPYRYSSRAFVKSASGDISGAIDDYKKAIELDPDDAISYNNLGMLEEQLGYKSKAEINFEKADLLAKKSSHILADEHKKSPAKNKNQTSENEIKKYAKTIADVFTKKEIRKEFFQFLKGKN